MSECWVYKAFHAIDKDEASDVLLYVGISDSPSERMSQHSNDKWWWHLVDRIDWMKASSREAAKSCESRVIKSKNPLFNKQESARTAGQTLISWLCLVQSQFKHCPLCLSHCKYSEAFWNTKGITRVEDEQGHKAVCFEVWMTCSNNHSKVSWCQFIPVEVLCKCNSRVPDRVVRDLVIKSEENGEIDDDISDIRPKTLSEMFCFESENASCSTPLLNGAQ